MSNNIIVIILLYTLRRMQSRILFLQQLPFPLTNLVKIAVVGMWAEIPDSLIPGAVVKEKYKNLLYTIDSPTRK